MNSNLTHSIHQCFKTTNFIQTLSHNHVNCPQSYQRNPRSDNCWRVITKSGHFALIKWKIQHDIEAGSHCFPSVVYRVDHRYMQGNIAWCDSRAVWSATEAWNIYTPLWLMSDLSDIMGRNCVPYNLIGLFYYIIFMHVPRGRSLLSCCGWAQSEQVFYRRALFMSVATVLIAGQCAKMKINICGSRMTLAAVLDASAIHKNEVMNCFLWARRITDQWVRSDDGSYRISASTHERKAQLVVAAADKFERTEKGFDEQLIYYLERQPFGSALFQLLPGPDPMRRKAEKKASAMEQSKKSEQIHRLNCIPLFVSSTQATEPTWLK